jgi:hypothetical protein
MATTLTATYQDSWIDGVKMKKVLYLVTINTYSAGGPLMSCSTYLPNYVYGANVIEGETNGFDIRYVAGSENGADLGKLLIYSQSHAGGITASSEVSSGGDLSALCTDLYIMFYGY